MDVPVINRLGDFHVGINSLPDPSLISRLFSFPGVIEFARSLDFWKWGAVILAFLATFSSLFRRLRVFIVRFRRKHSLALQNQIFAKFDYQDFSDAEDDVSSVSDYSSDDDDEEEEDEEEIDFDDATSTSYRNDNSYSSNVYEDFRVAGRSEKFDESQGQNGTLRLRRKFSLSDFANGKSIVKLWEGVGLGLELNSPSGSLISIYDLGRDQKISQFLGGSRQVAAASVADQTVVVTAGTGGETNNVELNVWDRRIGCQIPAVLANWGPVGESGGSFGVKTGGVGKVYVSNGVNGRRVVGDLRNFSKHLDNSGESDRETWWDANAAVVSDAKCE